MITFALGQVSREQKDLDRFSGVNCLSQIPVSLAQSAVLTVTRPWSVIPIAGRTRVRMSTRNWDEGPRHGAAARTERGRARVSAGARRPVRADVDRPSAILDRETSSSAEVFYSTEKHQVKETNIISRV